MNPSFYNIIGLSCIIPALVGIYLYKRMNKIFHLFVWMAFLTLIPEILNRVALKNWLFVKPYYLSTNIYMLLNFACYLLLIYRGGYIKRKIGLLFFATAIVVVVANLIYNKSIFSPLFYLLCFVSSVMLFTAIDLLSRQILNTKQRVTDSFWFWFSGTAILYNTFNLLVFGVYFFAMYNTPEGSTLGNIQHFGNFTCQLLFAFAMTKTINRSYQNR